MDTPVTLFEEFTGHAPTHRSKTIWEYLQCWMRQEHEKGNTALVTSPDYVPPFLCERLRLQGFQVLKIVNEYGTQKVRVSWSEFDTTKLPVQHAGLKPVLCYACRQPVTKKTKTAEE